MSTTDDKSEKPASIAVSLNDFLDKEIFDRENAGGDSKWTSSLTPAKATVVREWISARRQGLKSWRDFCKTDKFKMPTGPRVVVPRMAKNIDQFQSNYLCIFLILTLYCVLTSPILIFAIASVCGLWYFVRVRSANKQIVVAGRELNRSMQYAGVAMLAFPLFYLAGAGTIVFWVIGASIFLIAMHAFMYASEPVPGEEFLTMEEV